VAADVDCPSLFREAGIDASDTSVPFEVPAEFMADYTMQGRVKWLRYHGGHLRDIYLGKEALVSEWSQQLVEEWKAQALAGTLAGNYGVGESMAVLRGVRMAGVEGKHVLVIGSEIPWVEAICLAAGASRVTTLEYGTIESHHPQVGLVPCSC
jgi:hypothetical protein